MTFLGIGYCAITYNLFSSATFNAFITRQFISKECWSEIPPQFVFNAEDAVYLLLRQVVAKFTPPQFHAGLLGSVVVSHVQTSVPSVVAKLVLQA